jgi:hypothetical protein
LSFFYWASEEFYLRIILAPILSVLNRGELAERHSLIINLEFLFALLRNNMFTDWHREIEYYIRQDESRVETYNAQLGLPLGDRTLFPQ